MTAIVGEYDCGKTTLMKLLLNFYAPTVGQIKVSNQPLSTYSAPSMRRSSGIVMQDNFIFTDTIRCNIIQGESENEERQKQALRLTCVENFIEQHPLGVNTKIGAKSMEVSDGEKQRIMIARAAHKGQNSQPDNKHSVTVSIPRSLQNETLGFPNPHYELSLFSTLKVKTTDNSNSNRYFLKKLFAQIAQKT